MRCLAPFDRSKDTAAEAASPAPWVSLRMPTSTGGKLCSSVPNVTLGAVEKGVSIVHSIILSGRFCACGIRFGVVRPAGPRQDMRSTSRGRDAREHEVAHDSATHPETPRVH